MLPDYLAADLDVVFVGTSVGNLSAATNHYYSQPNNKFWELLWLSDLTGDRKLIPDQDSEILRYGIGLTDVVKGRSSSSDANLRASDYDIPGFLEKIEAYCPRVVAFNGKGASEKVARSLREAVPDLGLADWTLGQSQVYVLPSSSSTNYNPAHFLPKTRRKNGGSSLANGWAGRVKHSDDLSLSAWVIFGS